MVSAMMGVEVVGLRDKWGEVKGVRKDFSYNYRVILVLFRDFFQKLLWVIVLMHLLMLSRHLRRNITKRHFVRVNRG